MAFLSAQANTVAGEDEVRGADVVQPYQFVHRGAVCRGDGKEGVAGLHHIDVIPFRQESRHPQFLTGTNVFGVGKAVQAQKPERVVDIADSDLEMYRRNIVVKTMGEDYIVYEYSNL